MSESGERRRILDMLASGQISVDEAADLLGAVDSNGHDLARQGGSEAAKAVVVAAGREGGRKEATKRVSSSLRIVIESADSEGRNKGRTAVTVPLALAKFAGKLIPEEVRVDLEDQGIELAELLQALGQDMPEGRLIDIDAVPEDDEGRRSRIIVEVV